MNSTLQRISQHKPVLGIVQVTSAVASVIAFFLFYIVLGNALWIAGPIALVVLVAMWQLLVIPVQKQVIKRQVGAQAISAIEKKIAALTGLANKIPDFSIKCKVQEIIGHYSYALEVQRSKPDPLVAVNAQALTGIALTSTSSLISSYLDLVAKKQPAKQDQELLRNAEIFITNLAVATQDQAMRIKTMTEGGTDAQTGIEANMAALQMLFNIGSEKEGGL
jgi:hypothetical protein